MKPNLLKLAAYEDPVLHHKTEPVQFPLSDADKQTIADMLYSIEPKQLKAAGAPWDAAVGMAANQWGINKSIFLYCPTGAENGVEVVINPSYEVIRPLAIFAMQPSESDDWEGCFSVPLAAGCIRRDLKIRVKYQDQNGSVIEKELTDFFARVWQHENDHLNGYLYDDPRHGKCLEKRTFKNLDEAERFYNEVRQVRRSRQ